MKPYLVMALAALGTLTLLNHDSREHCLDDCKEVYTTCKESCKTHTCMLSCAREWVNCKKECKK